MNKRAPSSVIDTSDERWHVDRKVPVALLVTLLLTFSGQTVTALWWASKIDSRIEQLERVTATAAPTTSEQGTRLTRVETKLEAVQDGISEIKSILRKEPYPTKAR
jgi:hypothetical protein